MNSAIVFFLTLTELLAALIGYAMHSELVFFNVVIYGSPFYLMMNLLNMNSALIDKNPIYLVFILFHIVKYFFFFRAQMIDDSNALRKMATVFEVIYLAGSAYYMY